jgi:general secretion pathway protein F
MLNLPVIGEVLRAMEAARFASTLAILGKSAVPLVDAWKSPPPSSAT